jgi:hypothetical protein
VENQFADRAFENRTSLLKAIPFALTHRPPQAVFGKQSGVTGSQLAEREQLCDWRNVVSVHVHVRVLVYSSE